MAIISFVVSVGMLIYNVYSLVSFLYTDEEDVEEFEYEKDIHGGFYTIFAFIFLIGGGIYYAILPGGDCPDSMTKISGYCIENW